MSTPTTLKAAESAIKQAKWNEWNAEIDISNYQLNEGQMEESEYDRLQDAHDSAVDGVKAAYRAMDAYRKLPVLKRDD